MNTKPILFSAPMIRALLDGSKTQTRRVVKRKKFVPLDYVLSPSLLVDKWRTWWGHPEGLAVGYSQDCPYGQPGDLLWVRETFGFVSFEMAHGGARVDWTPDRPATKIAELPFGKGFYSGHVIYAADGYFDWCDEDGYDTERSFWKPSIHMPRAASRITLRIKSVRVERLNQISKEDAISEGLTRIEYKGESFGFDGGNTTGYGSATGAFRALWESINGAGSWDTNPWVWVVEFEVLKNA